MRFLFHWFFKITGFIPQALVFRTKILYEDRRVQSRRIRGRAIIAPNHTAVFEIEHFLRNYFALFICIN